MSNEFCFWLFLGRDRVRQLANEYPCVLKSVRTVAYHMDANGGTFDQMRFEETFFRAFVEHYCTDFISWREVERNPPLLCELHDMCRDCLRSGSFPTVDDFELIVEMKKQTEMCDAS